MPEWQYGRMAEWQDGRMTRWQNGNTAELQNGMALLSFHTTSKVYLWREVLADSEEVKLIHYLCYPYKPHDTV